MRELFDVQLNEQDVVMTTQELQTALSEADALCPTVTDDVNAEVLGIDSLRAKIIANYGVGFNHIDVHAARKAKLVVTNTPDVLTDCTADIAIGLMLMIARRLGEGERYVRGHRWIGWNPSQLIGTKMSGKTLGLIGMGRIGRAVAHRAYHGFGMKIIYFTPRPVPETVSADLQAQSLNSIEEVLEQADFVSLHCPGGEDTHHLINKDRLALMKPSSFLINTARGSVIDEMALVDALQSNRIGGAGLDVYENEPQVPEALLELENVVVLPHLGSATSETRIEMGMRAVDNLEAFFAGREPPDRIL